MSDLRPTERAEIDARIAAFERASASGQRPAIAASLPSEPKLRIALLIELFRVDQKLRINAGEPVRIESYLEEFPEIKAERAQLAELVAGEFGLRSACGESVDIHEYENRFPELRSHLQSLLAPKGPILPSEPAAEDTKTLVNATPADDDTTPPGDGNQEVTARFGRYILGEPLGQGAMGTVYRAVDTMLDIPVALKVPHRFNTDEATRRATFFSEARALARLHHPHLCRIFDVGEINGRLYISMALVDGKPLAWSAERSPRKAADLVRTVALALEEAHAIGVIHRDLKPTNIVLTAKDEPVVVDFGIAIRTSQSGSGQTQKNQIAGTLRYMSPEQARGVIARIGPASDVYNLGAVFYELLTARVPFEGKAGVELIDLISDPLRRADFPSKHCANVDHALDAICLQAIEKDPSRRFKTMREFAAALDAYLACGASSPSGPDRNSFQYEFVGVEQSAPQNLDQQDCLYVDAGNRLGVGVIDHRSSASDFHSSTSAVFANTELIRRTLKPWRRPDSPFTISMHETPDLDSVSACFLAEEYLARGCFPQGAEQLATYLDGVVEGSIGMAPDNRYSLYCAFMQLGHRAALRSWPARRDLWTQIVREGKQVVEYVLKTACQQGLAIDAVDAFNTPGVLGVVDRREIDADFERYERKLADRRCCMRRARLRLPTIDGSTRAIDMLFVRDVQNLNDPDRCMLFKDWARSDRSRCPETNGFLGLCLTSAAGPKGNFDCTISVRPDSRISLCELAEQLELEESSRRSSKYGIDDRLQDPESGQRREPRPGFANSDPWYDGRSHNFSIIGSPTSGTLLAPDDVYEIVVSRRRTENKDSASAASDGSTSQG